LAYGAPAYSQKGRRVSICFKRKSEWMEQEAGMWRLAGKISERIAARKELCHTAAGV
jgi:hypothetical protein